jgi:dTDP-4-amino-4,6-dideoxygalactose transaminase
VETAVYYRTPLHLEPVFADLASYPDGLPEAERAAREALALPLYVGLDRQRQSWVIDAIEEFFLGERTRG